MCETPHTRTQLPGKPAALATAPVIEESMPIAPNTALVSADQLHPNISQVPVVTTNAMLAELTPDNALAMMRAVRCRQGRIGL